MHAHVFLTALQLLAATYLLILTAAAVLGAHRGLLTYPFRAVYALTRILVLVLSFGHVRLSANVKRTRRRNLRRLRNARSVLVDYRDRRAEERAIARGEDPFVDVGGWAAAPAASATVAPAFTSALPAPTLAPPTLSAPTPLLAPELFPEDEVEEAPRFD